MKLKIRNLSKEIKGNLVLDHISLEMESGHIYGLQGKNGCGKTMLMRAICGLILCREGQIEINGKIMGKDITFPDSVGALIENPSFLPNCSGMDNLELLAAIRKKVSKEEIRSALEMVGLNPNDPKKYRKYSLGMKQRLGIACAVMEKPELVILDEPFNALDSSGVERIREMIFRLREEGTLVILACHDREELENLSDRIFVMNGGRIVEEI